MGRDMRKKCHQKHGKNISFSVSLKSLLFEVVIVNWGLEGSNLKILRLGRAYIPKHSKLLISNEKSSCEKIRKYNIQMDVQKIDRRVSQISYVDNLHA